MMGYVMYSVPIHGIKPSSPDISVTLPDGNTILSFHPENLNITGLPSASRQCPILPELTSGPLLSIGLLCDHHRDDNFHKKLVKTSLNGVPILTLLWSRNFIWNINQSQVPKPSTLHSNLVTYMATKKFSDRISFYHLTMFFSNTSAWCYAMNESQLTTWPHLTSKHVMQHLTESTAMLKVHMDQTHENNQSTQPPTYSDAASRVWK